MEDHDRALQVWREAAVRDRILVHVDAHHDCWWPEHESDICIANFIAPALRDRLLGEVFWVIPDGSWGSASSRAQVLIHLKRILSGFPEKGAVEIAPHGLRTTLLGKPFHALPLRHFRAPDLPVLLDIDTDFMVIDRVTYGAADSCASLPWCWPDELLSRLAVKVELATVAYSVTGGYTPLPWKWLGDEVALRLRGPSAETLQPMLLLREAAMAERNGREVDAEVLYREAIRRDGQSAAARLRLALLCRRTGRIEAARTWLREAIHLDPSYGTPYRSRGFFYQAGRMYAQAEEEHRIASELDECDPFPHLGLGQCSASKKQYLDAEVHLRRALELDPQLVDASCELGDVLRHLGRNDEAVAAYEKYLRLTLSGRKTMQMPICTAEPAAFRLDHRHFRIHARRAAALLRLGRLKEAEQGFRMSLEAGDRRPKIYVGLAQACWRTGRYATAACHAAESVAARVMDLSRRIRKRSARRWERLTATLRMSFMDPARTSRLHSAD